MEIEENERKRLALETEKDYLIPCDLPQNTRLLRRDGQVGYSEEGDLDQYLTVFSKPTLPSGYWTVRRKDGRNCVTEHTGEEYPSDIMGFYVDEPFSETKLW